MSVESQDRVDSMAALWSDLEGGVFLTDSAIHQSYGNWMRFVVLVQHTADSKWWWLRTKVEQCWMIWMQFSYSFFTIKITGKFGLENSMPLSTYFWVGECVVFGLEFIRTNYNLTGAQSTTSNAAPNLLTHWVLCVNAINTEAQENG